MKRKSLIFLFALIFMVVLSFSAVSADDLQSTDSGEVSGDVDVVTVNPWNTTGELTYDVSSEAKDIKSASVYVNVYAGSAKNTHGANANVSLATVNGEKQLASEQLWIEDGSTDGTIYTVNNHTNKCYSDYQMYYDITDSVKGLSNSAITIKVDTFKMENKTFDGRIKLIALVLAYDDGDDDKITYFVDSTQKWTKTNVTTTFATQNVVATEASLTNVALSSADGSFRLNGELIGDPDNHSSGNYYQYSTWKDVTPYMVEGKSTEIMAINVGTSSYASLKNVLTVLKVKNLKTDKYGVVSGDVAVVTVNPWNTTGNLTYEIPADAKVIKSADVYVNIYGGSAKNTHGANANVALITSNGQQQLASESLWIPEGTTDGTVYVVNDHTDKCYSDYQMHYDITDAVKGLSGSSITVKVDTSKMENKTFDGRIKLIALVFAYDDGDNDKIAYFVDSTQKWTKTNVTTTFATENVANILDASLTNVALSSADGSFRINAELIGDPTNHTAGNYYQYSTWDKITSYLKECQKTELLASNVGTSTYASLKNVLSVLKIESAVEAKLTVKALSTSYDSGKTFDVMVVDADNNPVKNLKLNLKVFTGKNSKDYEVTTNANGVATFKASTLAVGTHNVEITSKDEKVIVEKTTSSIKISKAKTAVKAPNVASKVKKSKYFKVLVKNAATKKVVKNLKIKVKVYTGKKYKIYTIKTGSNGIAKLNVKSLKVGTHKVVIGSGNAKYAISAKSKIVIKK